MSEFNKLLAAAEPNERSPYGELQAQQQLAWHYINLNNIPELIKYLRLMKSHPDFSAKQWSEFLKTVSLAGNLKFACLPKETTNQVFSDYEPSASKYVFDIWFSGYIQINYNDSNASKGLFVAILDLLKPNHKTSFRELSFELNHAVLTKNNYKELADALKNNLYLQLLQIKSHQQLDKESVECLLDAIKTHPLLTKLVLKNVPHNPDMLNYLTDFLKSNETLTHVELYLSDSEPNQSTPKLIEQIKQTVIDALKMNFSLRELYVYHNGKRLQDSVIPNLLLRTYVPQQVFKNPQLIYAN